MSARRLAALALLAALAAPGCRTGTGGSLLVTPTDRKTHPVADSALGAFEQFRGFLRAENYQAAYNLLSEESRAHYKKFEFDVTFQETRFGTMLRYQYTEWDIAGVTVDPDGRRAEIVLRHYIYPENKKTVTLVKDAVAGGTAEWRIRFVLSDVIGMPEADERALFPAQWGGAGGGGGENDFSEHPPRR